ncbi:MAG: hypothetical protein A3A96_02290 [Candidatus Zambryskibacteria bacterium RIFCSPLOWO2_01_FULL_39_39]|uniref:Uncharacterized protein n=1 Tax=Candidatus Zambryskibacteria bacterium RIFCSPLOWO2_01_FULL_39_39 TaxID=1802758 RepID=A0A1G2U0B5_9BACT|nr:MAG: hypothetical protein A2644_03075 [Candidatus Zambryskibacteria bacterium RIFCSPHIGHO2_01_FULL_39_63]OHA98742.1 MAG: hypothetical protein A3F20_01695 [Candidatus Zambryskibacteria bacterium RIFCSPHIGHO2_12_FULL_39_21]OHB02262.1 MAG: hypothetical protein A3A96_02290 [Candidatus Zambryskibacteria bacterium RIFCSPLOWO2_01_FULL_39_39]
MHLFSDCDIIESRGEKVIPLKFLRLVAFWLGLIALAAAVYTKESEVEIFYQSAQTGCVLLSIWGIMSLIIWAVGKVSAQKEGRIRVKRVMEPYS